MCNHVNSQFQGKTSEAEASLAAEEPENKPKRVSVSLLLASNACGHSSRWSVSTVAASGTVSLELYLSQQVVYIFNIIY